MINFESNNRAMCTLLLEGLLTILNCSINIPRTYSIQKHQEIRGIQFYRAMFTILLTLTKYYLLMTNF